jgi:hypothetical protein
VLDSLIIAKNSRGLITIINRESPLSGGNIVRWIWNSTSTLHQK